MRLARFWILGTAVLAAACLHRAALAPQANPNVITADEIRANHASNVYDLIAQLHPEFLRDRGAVSVLTTARDVATVFLNAEEYGPISSLSHVSPNDVAEIRYFSGVDAVQKFGRQYGGGVIQLISRSE